MSVTVMTITHMKMGVQPTPETSRILNIPQTVGNIQHNIGILV